MPRTLYDSMNNYYAKPSKGMWAIWKRTTGMCVYVVRTQREAREIVRFKNKEYGKYSRKYNL
jgi:hypothetical protein